MLTRQLLNGPKGVMSMQWESVNSASSEATLQKRVVRIMTFSDPNDFFLTFSVCNLQTMYGQKKNFSTFSYKLVQISPIMILVHSGAFLSISSWFCELTELIFVMIPYISSTGCPPTTQRIMGHVQVANRLK